MIPPSSCYDFMYAVKISDYSADPYSTKKAFVSTHHSTGCSRPRLKSRGDFQRHICRETSFFSRVSRTELGMCQNTLKISAVNGNMNASRWLWDPRLHAVRWHGGCMMCPQGDWHKRKKENHRFLSKKWSRKKNILPFLQMKVRDVLRANNLWMKHLANSSW